MVKGGILDQVTALVVNSHIVPCSTARFEKNQRVKVYDSQEDMFADKPKCILTVESCHVRRKELFFNEPLPLDVKRGDFLVVEE